MAILLHILEYLLQRKKKNQNVHNYTNYFEHILAKVI